MNYFYILFSAFTVSCFLSFIFIRYSDYFIFGKRMNQERVKLHKKGVPRLGGTVIYISCLILFAVVLLMPGRHIFGIKLSKLAAVGISSFIIFIIGLYDDVVKRLSYKIKFVFQLLSVLVLIYAGYTINVISIPFYEDINLGILGVFAFAIWMLAMMNAINLIDGLDGLASGICLIAASGFLVVSFIQGHYFIFYLLLVFVGALLGFLKYNFYPAKLFLGDSGSIFLGFILALAAVEISIKRVIAVSLAIPILTLFVPALSVIFTFTRRLAAGKNPFKPDSMHLHYRLIRAGISHRNTVIIFYVVTLIFMMFGIICYLLPVRYEIFIVSLAFIIALALYSWAVYFIKNKTYKRKSIYGLSRRL